MEQALEENVLKIPDDPQHHHSVGSSQETKRGSTGVFSRLKTRAEQALGGLKIDSTSSHEHHKVTFPFSFFVINRVKKEIYRLKLKRKLMEYSLEITPLASAL